MRKSGSIQKMTVAGLLIALGIIIPTFSPFKIIIGPASFTLASHVPIFIAMFVSPAVAIAVSIGTTLGFVFGGFPLVIVLRAASHVIFVSIGSYYLSRNPEITQSPAKLRVYSLLIGIIHALAEVLIVSIFFFGNYMTDAYYEGGFFYTVLLLVGIGGVVHSMVDFEIAWFITKAISRKSEVASLFESVRFSSNPNKTGKASSQA